MLKNRYLFPAIYVALLLPAILGSSTNIKAVALCACLSLALIVNLRSIVRIGLLLLTAFCTLIPFLLLVQSAICSSHQTILLSLGDCVIQSSVAVLLNVGSLSAVFLLATANEWRGSAVETINGMAIPRTVRTMAIVSSAMIGEFRRAMTRVHQAFTARGEAMPSISARNLIVLAPMLGAAWASVLNGVVERTKEQWSSEAFWERYVTARRQQSATIALSDLSVLGLSGIVIVLMLLPLHF